MDLSKVTWVVEQEMFLKNEKSIKEAVQKYGMKYYPYVDCDFKNSLDKMILNFSVNECVIAYGCLDVIQKFQRELAYVPTSYANFPNLKCSAYYPRYSKHLLAQEYAFYPFGVLDNMTDQIFDKYSVNDQIFIRPDSGAKTFTGKVLDREKCENGIASGLKGWIYNDIAPEELVLVAKPSKILNEYRFIAGAGEVVSGSRYMTIDESGDLVHDEDSSYSQDAWDLALEVAKEEWTPDSIFSIDIAEIECYGGSEFKLIEVNGFSTCDWYLCDIDAVIKAASEIALKEWEEYK